MKTILLWDARFPDRRPARLTVEDTVASAAVRAGVAAPANPADAGVLSTGAALDPGLLTEVLLQHGPGGATRRVMLPYSVVMVGAAAGVLAAIGTPIPGGVTPTPTPTQIGGMTVGAEGAPGTIYANRILVDGDDFSNTTAADFLTPTNNAGAYMTTRHYGVQSTAPRYLRGAASLGGYEADPWHTGYKNANKGVVPSSYADMITFGDGSLKLKSRRATTAEKQLMGPLVGKNNLSSMVHMARRNMMRANGLMEMMLRFPYAISTWDQWHPTFWVIQSQPGNGFDGLELDCEGFGPALQFNRNTWNNGVGSYGPTLGTTQTVSKTQYRNYGFETVLENGVWTVRLFEDGVAVASGPANYGGNTFDPSRPFHLMMTNHILQENLTQSVFDAAGDAGAVMDCDFWRVFMPKGATYRTPAVSAAEYLIDFDTAFSLNLPTPAAVWGAGASADVIEMIPNEDNTPAKPWVRTLLPASVTRTGDVLAGQIADQPGRLILARSYTPALGDGCRPQPITICVGPRVSVTQIEYVPGQALSYDLFAQCEFGDLHMNSTIAVAGLPSGAIYDQATNLVTWSSPADVGDVPLTITLTNRMGQVNKPANRNVVLKKTVASNYAYKQWNGPGWFQAADAATVDVSNSVVTGWTNKRSGGGNLQSLGSAGWTYVPDAQNGRPAVRLTKNTASKTTMPRLSASGSNVPISQAFQGDDKPYLVIAVYKPLDAVTGFVWAASKSTGTTTDAETVALVRRSGAASSIRRANTTTPTNDVAFNSAAGSVSGAPRITATRFNGTTIDIWDNSTTKTVAAAAQDASAFTTGLVFRLGATEAPDGNGPGSFSTVQSSADYYEVIIEATRTDAEIVQAMTDLATYHGITLS